jgi:hypothetical protein
LTKASEESVKDLTKIKIGWWRIWVHYDVHNHLWKHGDAQCYRGKTSRIVEIIISSIETISIDDGKNHRNFTSRIVAILIWAIIECLYFCSFGILGNVGPTARFRQK